MIGLHCFGTSCNPRHLLCHLKDLALPNDQRLDSADNSNILGLKYFLMEEKVTQGER